MQGVVFNAHYLAWFDVSLGELWRAAFGGYGFMLERGVDLVVAEARVRFVSPARFDDALVLTIAVARLGTTSMRTEHRINREGEVLAEGEMVHVFVDRETLGKTPVPPWAREGLAPWTLG